MSCLFLAYRRGGKGRKITSKPTLLRVESSCRFRPMASSPQPFAPTSIQLDQVRFQRIEWHIEIIPRSFIRCVLRLLVAGKPRTVGGELEVKIL